MGSTEISICFFSLFSFSSCSCCFFFLFLVVVVVPSFSLMLWVFDPHSTFSQESDESSTEEDPLAVTLVIIVCLTRLNRLMGTNSDGRSYELKPRFMS